MIAGELMTEKICVLSTDILILTLSTWDLDVQQIWSSINQGVIVPVQEKVLVMNRAAELG